jgi:hypothetical protein
MGIHPSGANACNIANINKRIKTFTTIISRKEKLKL